MSGSLGAPLRVVHCFRAPVGGLWRHVADLAGEQSARGHAVGIICDSTTGGDRADAQLARLKDACALGIHRFEMSRMPGFGDFHAIRRAASILKTLQPDVIHGHGAKGGLYGRIIGIDNARGQRALTAYTPHGGSLNYNPGSIAGRIFLQAERYLEKRTGLLLFESDYARRVFEERVCKPDCEVAVVHNGVRDEDFEPVELDEDATELLFIGELRHAKGIDVLIEALKILRTQDRVPTLTIVGSGPDDAALKVLAEPLGTQVRFLAAEDARRAFARAPSAVLPSRAESLPYVVLEAAAAARNIITTDVGGIAEIFGPDSNWLIPPGDPGALAQAIALLDTERQAHTELADRLNKRVREDFSVHTMADGILNAYRRAMRPR